MANRKTALAVGAAVLVSIVALAALSSQEARPPAADRPKERFEEALPTAGELKNLALQYDNRIHSLEARSEEMSKLVQALQESLAKLATLVDETRRSERSILDLIQGIKDKPPEPERRSGRILAIDLESPKDADRAVHIPAGSFGEATLLTGVYAPVTGEPLPVLLRLDSLLVGPNKSRVPIRGAFLVGKAIGDANTARAVVQISGVSLVLDDGKTVEKPANGYVVDADGIQGLVGRYVWNADQIAGLSILSGAAQGASNALATSQTTTFGGPLGVSREVTKDAAKFTGYNAASSAFANIGKILEDRMKEFVPAVFVSNASRQVTVVFLEGVTLDGFSKEKK